MSSHVNDTPSTSGSYVKPPQNDGEGDSDDSERSNGPPYVTCIRCHLSKPPSLLKYCFPCIGFIFRSCKGPMDVEHTKPPEETDRKFPPEVYGNYEIAEPNPITGCDTCKMRPENTMIIHGRKGHYGIWCTDCAEKELMIGMKCPMCQCIIDHIWQINP